MPGKEWSSKTGAESGLGFRHAPFRPRNLSGITREKMVHRLFWRQSGDRRKHPKSICSKKHYVNGVACPAWNHSIRDIVDGIRSPRILRYRTIIKIYL